MTKHAFRGIARVHANAADPVAILGEIRSAFQDHRSRTDERFAELQGQLADVAARATAIGLSGAGRRGDGGTERREVAAFVREGSADNKLTVNASLSVDSDPDGGYAVSPVVGGTIQRKLFDASPLARLCRRVQMANGDSYEELWDASDIGATWVGEREDRPATDSPNLRVLNVPLHEIYANIPVTQRLLDDSQFDIAGWVAERIGEKFARSVGAALVKGDGIQKPRGLLSYPTSTDPDATRPWGTIQHINTGAAGAFDTPPAGGDKILDLVYSLRASARRWRPRPSAPVTDPPMTEAEARIIVRSVTPAAVARWRAVGRAAVEIEGEVGRIVDPALAAALGRVAGQWSGTLPAVVVVLEAATGRR